MEPSILTKDHELRKTDAILEPTVWATVKTYIAEGGSPETVVQALSQGYKGYAEMCNLVAKWLLLSGTPLETVLAPHVSNHIKTLLEARFDPRKADTLFEEGAAAPRWLEFMIQSPEWRTVLYRLADSYKHCLLLDFAIQRISEAGHHNEIASLATASTYFAVFNRVFCDLLERLLTADELTFSTDASLHDLKNICLHSQHAYMYTQAVLRKLQQDSTYGARLRRLAQELEEAASDRGQLPRRIAIMLSGQSEYPEVAASLASMLSAKTTNPGDILKLYQAYTQPNPPPLEFLRTPQVLELLTKDLFNPNKKINPAHRGKYLYLLAYAAAARGDKSDEIDVAAALRSLEIVLPLCQKNSLGSELEASVRVLREHLTQPVVGMGLLFWIRCNLADAGFYVTSYHSLSAPVYLLLLKEVAYYHPLQRADVLALIVEVFELKTDLDPLADVELKKSLLEVAVYLLALGYVEPVLLQLEKWSCAKPTSAATTDPALIRYFVMRVLRIASPPYSLAFAASMLRLLGSCSPESLQSAETREMVAQFAANCRIHRHQLGAEEQAVLGALPCLHE